MKPFSLTLSRSDWREVLGSEPPEDWPFTFGGIRADSRRIRSGDVFVAIQGVEANGAAFIADAIKRGAAGIIAGEQLQRFGHVPVVKVDHPRRVLAHIANIFYGKPDTRLTVTGITGTNGKTSVSRFLYQVFSELGQKAGLIGTVEYAFGLRRIPSRQTTPGPPELQEYLREMVDAHCEHCVMEVSSHGLDQGRVHGLNIRNAVFTNLSQEHLDYHHDMETYFQCKRKLFEMDSVQVRVVGEDDWSDRLAEEFGPDVVRCGLKKDSDFRAEDVRMDMTGVRAKVYTPSGAGELSLPLLGQHNLRNALQALAILMSEGVPLDKALHAFESLKPAPGRLESVSCPRGTVLVDYAHTPDALNNVLNTLRPLTHGRLWVVFGCGGDRDPSKRGPMAAAVAEHADEIILTTDNPRMEDPEQILMHMKAGIPTGVSYRVLPDRGEAIRTGLEGLKENDVLLIAGKGHETTQDLGSIRIPFDDRAVAAKWISSMHGIQAEPHA